jgi:hypothetical protein
VLGNQEEEEEEDGMMIYEDFCVINAGLLSPSWS